MRVDDGDDDGDDDDDDDDDNNNDDDEDCYKITIISSHLDLLHSRPTGHPSMGRRRRRSKPRRSNHLQPDFAQERFPPITEHQPRVLRGQRTPLRDALDHLLLLHPTDGDAGRLLQDLLGDAYEGARAHHQTGEVP